MILLKYACFMKINTLFYIFKYINLDYEMDPVKRSSDNKTINNLMMFDLMMINSAGEYMIRK